MKTIIHYGLLAVGLTGASAIAAEEDHSAHQMDHSQHAMPVQQSQNMDHSAHQKTAPAQESGHGNHSARDAVSSNTALRDPNAYANGYDYGQYGQMELADTMNFGSVMVDHVEAMQMGAKTAYGYALKGWWGRDFNRFAFKSDGEGTPKDVEEIAVEAAWSHAIAAYWNSQLGMRADTDGETPRYSLALGVAGLAPYWFEVDANLYVDEKGRVAFRGGAEYELLFTQKLILQPMAEITAYSKSDNQRRRGGGLSDIGLALRLRYEIKREFAPYVGLEWKQKFGTTADYAKTAGEHASETMMVAGLRLML